MIYIFTFFIQYFKTLNWMYQNDEASLVYICMSFWIYINKDYTPMDIEPALYFIKCYHRYNRYLML